MKKNRVGGLKYENSPYICHPKSKYADVAQLVERNLAKVEVVGSSLIIRSTGNLREEGSLFYFNVNSVIAVGVFQKYYHREDYLVLKGNHMR